MFNFFKKKQESKSCKSCVYYSEASLPDKLLPDKTVKKGGIVAITCSKMDGELTDFDPCDLHKKGSNTLNTHAILHYIKFKKGD